MALNYIVQTSGALGRKREVRTRRAGPIAALSASADLAAQPARSQGGCFWAGLHSSPNFLKLRNCLALQICLSSPCLLKLLKSTKSR